MRVHTEVLPELIWFQAKGRRQERLMAVSPVRQITPDSACRGWVEHTPPPCLRCVDGCAEEVKRSFTRCKFQATFGEDPWTIEPTWPQALCATWSVRQTHLGKSHTCARVICLTQVHHVSRRTHTHTHHAWTRAPKCTHAWVRTHTQVFVRYLCMWFVVIYWRNAVGAASFMTCCFWFFLNVREENA